jgi:PAS domain S-box-containing protein
VSELFPELGESRRVEKIKKALRKSSRYDKYIDVITTGDPFEHDNFLLMTVSGLKYISLKAFRVGDGLGVIATDITERKQMEDQMYRDKQDWEDTFNAITDAITIHDNDFNIIHSNKAAEKILGLPERDNSNGKCFEYFHGTEGPPQNCPSCECLKTREPCISEMYEPHLGKYIEIRALPRFDKNNDVIGIIHVVRDITKRKTAEKQINRQFDRLQALRTIDVAITASLDLGHTLNVFLDQVTSQLRADAVDVLLYNRYSLMLEYAAGKGFRSDAVKYSRLKLGEGVAGKIAKDRRSMTIYELQEKRSAFTRSLMAEEEDFVTYFGVPLVAKGNLLGVMEIYQRSLFEPDDDWVDFLGALAGQAAIAIDNAALFNELKDSHDNLIMAYETTIEGWARALDYRDRETEGHSRRVSELTINMAREMRIGEKELVHIQRGALLHDIGKIGVPDNILLKTDSLTDDEWKIMKKHPEFARDLLFGIPFLRQALDIPYCHHERWDGTGYPRGIKGNEIPVAARIFSVIDHWDAMTSDRPYRPAIPDKKVREEIKSLAGFYFDPEVVKTFLRMNIKSN